jgi:MOSC domain-containing protein YiiM
VSIVRLYVSAEHVYTGHFGQAAGSTPMVPTDRAQIVAGRGIVGDRYFHRPPDSKGQVTFFAEETWLRLRAELGRSDLGPEVFRRNVVVRDTDLWALIGAEFEIQGLRFQGTEYCKPCFWMDQAFSPGTLDRLVAWKAGGLRARALSDGWLTADLAKEAVCSA